MSSITILCRASSTPTVDFSPRGRGQVESVLLGSILCWWLTLLFHDSYFRGISETPSEVEQRSGCAC
jgi:hypothetical protein